MLKLTVDKIRAGTATAEELTAALESHSAANPGAESPVFLVIYAIHKTRNVPLLSQTAGLVAERLPALTQAFDSIIERKEVCDTDCRCDTLGNVDEKALCQKAFPQGLECGCAELCMQILIEKEVVLTAELLVQILQSPAYTAIADIIRLGLASPELDPTNAKPLEAAMELMREAHVLAKVTAARFVLGSAVRIAISANLGAERLVGILECCRCLGDPTGVAALLAAGRRDEALRLLLTRYPVDDVALLCALKEGDYEFAFRYLMLTGWQVGDTARADVVDSLFALMQGRTSHSLANLLLLRKLSGYFTYQEAQKLIATIQVLWLGDEDEASRAIVACANPIQVLVLAIELCGIVNSLYPAMSIKTTDTQDSLAKIISSIQGEFEREEEMRDILLSKDIEGRATVAVMVENNMLDLLQNPHVEALANEVWRGPYDSGKWQTVMDSSYLLDQIASGVNGEGSRKYSSGVFNRNIQKCATHPFEFSSWKHGAFVRTLMTAVEYIVIYGLVFAFYNLAIRAFRDITTTSNGLQAAGITDEDAIRLLANLKDNVRDCMRSIHGFQISMIILDVTLVKLIIEYVYQYLTKRRVNFSAERLFFMAVILALVQLEIFYYGLKFDLSIWDPADSRALTQAISYANADYHDVFLAILLLILGLRVLYGFRAFAVVGPFIQILGAMAKTAVVFICFFVMLVLIFCMSYSVLIPEDYVENTSVWRAFVTIFQATTAVYDLNAKDYKVKGEVFYMIDVLTFNIMLISFFVAVLSDIFSRMSSKALPLYLQEVLVLRNTHAPNKHYQFALSSFIGFDVLITIFVLPFFPFLSPERRAKVNAFLLYVEYSLAFVLILPFYICILTVLVPICYLQLIVQHALDMFTGTEQTIWRIARFAFMLVFGPLVVIFYWGTDIVYFAWECYGHMPAEKYSRTQFDSVGKKDLKAILKGLTDCKETELGREELVKRMLGSLGIGAVKPAAVLTLAQSSSDATRVAPHQEPSSSFPLYLTMMQFVRNYASGEASETVEKQLVQNALEGFSVAARLREDYRNITFYGWDDSVRGLGSNASEKYEAGPAHVYEHRIVGKEWVNIKLIRCFNAATYRRGMKAFFSQRNAIVAANCVAQLAKVQQEQSQALSEILDILKGKQLSPPQSQSQPQITQVDEKK